MELVTEAHGKQVICSQWWPNQPACRSRADFEDLFEAKDFLV